jgi:DNA-binding transcriptional LysR family regulator
MAEDQTPETDPVQAARDRWLGVEIRHLAALEAIVREGSFRGAADSLGYVQSAISQQVSHLEQLVGTRLIERSRGSSPIALTDAGRLLLDHVEIILSRFQAAQSDLDALVQGRAGVLRVGAFQSAATRLFPHVLPSFARVAPDVRIVPTEMQTDAPLFGLVERGEVDLAFCQLPIADGPFESIDLMEDPFVLVVSGRSPLAEQDEPPSLAEIGDMPLIGFNDSRAQDRVLEALRARGIEPEFVFRSDLNATVQSLVAADIGVAIAPYLSVDPQHPGTSVIELPDLPPRKIVLIWHRDRARPPSAALFTDAVRTTCARRFRFERAAHADGPEEG